MAGWLASARPALNCSSRGDEAQIAGGKVRASLRPPSAVLLRRTGRLLREKMATLVEPALRLVAPAAIRFDEETGFHFASSFESASFARKLFVSAANDF